MACECGNDKFMARRKDWHDVTVDEHGTFIKDDGIYESNTPYGPFTCTECDKEYEELPKT